MPVSRRTGAVCMAAFLVLLALSFIPGRHGAAALFGAFYRSGALVFGGGHVVLPLLHDAVVARRWVSDGLFLAGYGAAQALPGPLFTLAAYLGALASPVRGVAGAVIALLAIFLPGILVLMGVLPFWNRWRGHAGVQAVTRGINATVVGILGAAFYSPVWTSAVHRPLDFAVALAGFGLLVIWRMPPLMMVLLAAAISTLLPAAT